MKRRHTECKRIFPNYIYKIVVSRVYQEFNNRKMCKHIQKWAKDLNRYFSKKDRKVANRHMKKCSTSLGIGKCQSKLKLQWDTTSSSSGWLLWGKKQSNKCWQGCGNIRTCIYCCWECKMVQPLCGKQLGNSSKY